MQYGKRRSVSNNIREEWTTGARLERYIYDHGFTKERLAEESGVNIGTIYRICSGESIGRIDTWNMIANAMGCTVSDITGK